MNDRQLVTAMNRNCIPQPSGDSICHCPTFVRRLVLPILLGFLSTGSSAKGQNGLPSPERSTLPALNGSAQVPASLPEDSLVHGVVTRPDTALNPEKQMDDPIPGRETDRAESYTQAADPNGDIATRTRTFVSRTTRIRDSAIVAHCETHRWHFQSHRPSVFRSVRNLRHSGAPVALFPKRA